MSGSTRKSAAEWLAHLETAQREGVTLAAYARARGLSKRQLYRAKQKLRRVAAPLAKTELDVRAKHFLEKQNAPFAQVRVLAAPGLAMPSKLLARLPNGVTVELECTAGDVSLVSALIETLGRCHVSARR